MQPKQIFLINGGLYYLDNGKYYPFRIAGAGGGGRRNTTIIQEDMKLHTVTFTRNQIIAFGTGVIANQAKVLPKAPAGYKNQLKSITETYRVGTGTNYFNRPLGASIQLQYFLNGFEDNGNSGNGLFTDNTDCLSFTVNRTTRVDLQNERANNSSMQNHFHASLNSYTLEDDLKIGIKVGDSAIQDGNPDATLTIDVAYNVLKKE